MRKSPLQHLLPRWARGIRPYPTGKPIEEVERELGHSAIKLASNENPFGASPKAIEAIRKELHHIHLYPDSTGHEVCEELAAINHVDTGQIILGAGSTELIELAARTFLSAGDEGLGSESSFLVFELAVAKTGASLVLAPLREKSIDLGAIRRAVTPRTKMIYLANPNNPTGTIFTASETDHLLSSLPPHVLVVLDEAYYEYVQRNDYSHSLEYIHAGRNVLVLRTFSKVHGLAGLRLGYGIGHPELIASLDRVRAPFNTSRPAQSAALAALEDREHVATSVESNRREKQFLCEELALSGVGFTASAANFLLIDTGRDCEQDFLRLLQEGVIVRPMRVYGFPTALRVTVARREDNRRFLEALERISASPARVSD